VSQAAAGRSTRIGIRPKRNAPIDKNPGLKFVFPWGASGIAAHPEPGTFPGAEMGSPLADLSDEEFRVFADREVINGRWAMLGVSGMWAQENFGLGPWFDVYNNCKGLTCDLSYWKNPFPTVEGNVVGLFILHAVVLGFAEAYRGGLLELPTQIVDDMAKTQTKTSGTVYPGGAFDPLGLASPKKPVYFRGGGKKGIDMGGVKPWAPFAKGAEDVDSLKLKELKHGRLAMGAFAGMVGQSFATNGGMWQGGHGPVANFLAHINDVNFCNVLDQSGCVYN